MKALPIVLLSLAAVVSGCSTPYQEATAMSMTGGWRIKQVEGDVYRVVFSANGYTTRETAQTYWLYRAAQAALENGYTGFEILSNINLVQTMTPEQFFAQEDQTKHHVAYVYTPIYTNTSSHPYIEADVRLLKGKIEENPPKVFDATKLKDALEPIVNGNKCSMGNVCEHVHKYLFPAGKFDKS